METLENKIAKYGKALITDFYILIRITAIYDSLNDAILNAAQRLLADIMLLLDETGEITVKVIEGSFYIEGNRIKAGVSDIENFSSLADELHRRSVGVLDFRAPLAAEDLIRLAYAIKSGADTAGIQAAVEKGSARKIGIGGPVFLEREEGIDLKDNEAVARRAYLKALSAMKEMDKAVKTGTRLKLKKIKRTLQLIVDCIVSDESYLLRFAMARHQGNYYVHPVNVAILSTALGKRVGLDRVCLRNLALSAFFHDAGKHEIPLDLLNRMTGSPKEEELMKRHPVDGIRVILKSLGLSEVSILSMLVSFEHHMKYDLSGYPETAGTRRLNIFSRIVSIADDFDSMRSRPASGVTKVGIRDVLALLRKGSGTLYDPFLVKAFSDIFS